MQLDECQYYFHLTSYSAAWNVIVELWPHVAMILYHPYHSNHAFFTKVFLGAASVMVVGTTAGAVMVVTICGRPWSEWALEAKILAPTLHTLFTIAQIHGIQKLFIHHRKQKRLATEESARADKEMELTRASEVTG